MAEMFALSTGIALGLDNYSALTEAMNWAKRDSSLSYILLLDNEGEEFASYNPDSLVVDVAAIMKKGNIVESGGLLHTIVPMKYLDNDYGTLFLGYSLAEMHGHISGNKMTSLYISLMILVLGIGLSLLFSNMITKPIIRLSNAANELGEGNYLVDIEVTTSDEIGILSTAFKTMANRINKTMLALRLSEKKLSDITSTLGEGVCVLDEQGQITFVNPEAEKLLGWKENELLGKKMHSKIHYENADGDAILAEDCNLLKVIKDGKDYKNSDDVFFTKNKETFPVAYISTPILQDEKVTGSVIAFHGIKERKELIETLRDSGEKFRLLSEQLAETDSMKELLLDIITHDLKNPAGVINGFSGILLEQDPTDEMLQSVNDSSNRLLKVIENATALASVAMGESIEKQNINLNQMLQDVKSEFEQMAKHAEMEIKFHSQGDIFINANPILSEVFKNYLSNSIKYAKEGKQIILEIIEGKGSTQVYIKDFGTTITKENREAIFLRQARLDNPAIKGRGLGLAIVKRIAEAHGSKVWVEPNEPTGNSFCFEIPNET
ncbi:MAG: PAS domain S-box protein [Armatimonadetes bacterium]|nr:PAS domain S-box protein [Armatimonadota bacterium]